MRYEERSMIFVFRTMRTRSELARDLGCTVGQAGALLWRSRHYVDRIEMQAQMLVIPEEPLFSELITRARSLSYVTRVIPMGTRFYVTSRTIPLVL